jgi:hypothetical protein
MAVYRQVCAPGHHSVVAVLTRCGLPLPAYFLADEKHSHCLTNRVYLPTIVNGMWMFHALVILCHALIPLSHVARPRSCVTAPSRPCGAPRRMTHDVTRSPETLGHSCPPPGQPAVTCQKFSSLSHGSVLSAAPLITRLIPLMA